MPRIYLSVPHMGENEFRYVRDAFESNWLSTVGPNLDALEGDFREMVGLPGVALVNGTAGVHLACRLLGIAEGDEVVTPTLTFAASCNPVLYVGARPVFIDCERATWNLDPNRLDEWLKRRAGKNRLPKAVEVVHVFGQSADMDAISEICGRYELPILEDAAESLGARYKGRASGTGGDVSVFSFNGNKMLTGTSGGMLCSPREEWVAKARHWATQSRDPDPEGINNYVHTELGFNYRLSNVLAGIVRGQLEVLEDRVRQRRAVFDRYCEGFADLPGIVPQPEADFGSPEDVRTGRTRHTRWLSCFLVDEGKEKKFRMSSAGLIRALAAEDIEARPVWRPMHTQPLYHGYECIGGDVAEDLNRRGICLPSSSSLSEADQERVIQGVRGAVGARR